MFKQLSLSLLIAPLLLGQTYHWPIRAAESLSATFCEYRSGHLHAGIDIKTWGELEVPCLAAGDGYIEQVFIGYRGYGRGLKLRLSDGHVAVYGHLEKYTPAIEELIQIEQFKQDRYQVRLNFSATRFKVRAGQVIGFSGTSGTEHPHLHFELRDSMNQAINPQRFFTGIKDTQDPVIDELLLLPVTADSRINGSRFPVIIDLAQARQTVVTTGPFEVAVNSHDRANGTYNKYNIYQAQLFLDDSLAFQQQFDQIPMSQTNEVDQIYPGMQGQHGWHFMALFSPDTSSRRPFARDDLTGVISPRGLETLRIRTADIKGNACSDQIMVRQQAPENWTVEQTNGSTIITRYYTSNGYERFQFYSQDQRFLPVAQTLYRLQATTWILNLPQGLTGVRGLGTIGGAIKWIIPPPDQVQPELTTRWRTFGDYFVLELESQTPYTFPLSLKLLAGPDQLIGELVQIDECHAESMPVPLSWRALAEQLQFPMDPATTRTLGLQPYTALPPGSRQQLILPTPLQGQLTALNSGIKPLYLQLDTLLTIFDDQGITGVRLDVLQSEPNVFQGLLTFDQTRDKEHYSIFTPARKQSWRRLASPDSSSPAKVELTSGGEFFLLRDDRGPTAKVLKPGHIIRRGTRLVFDLQDNSGIIRIPAGGFKAQLDEQSFFPDYNPLRRELSFHIPTDLKPGQHQFQITLEDATGNTTNFAHIITVSR